MTFLNELAERGVKLVIMPGNHDLEWAWLVGGEVPRRYMRQMYPVEMQELMERLVARENVAVQSVFMVDDTAIVHGHEGWHGDWLWRISEIGDRATRYKMVGGQMRRKVMGGAPLSVRAMAVSGHGFYRRLAAWGRKLGKHHVIHGHTHVHGRRMRFGITIDCLPAWRASEGPGGGMRLVGGVWENVGV